MIIPENTTILIVDDNPLIIKTYERILRQHGYRILTAINGESALKMIRENSISLILLDVILPDIPGLEILRSIKSNPQTELIFVVLISSLATTIDNQIEAMDQGADGYLVKPMEGWELVLRVKGFLKHKNIIDLLRISERKYQRISKKATLALKESNAYLRALLDNNSTIFVAMDKNCIIQFANRPAMNAIKTLFNKKIILGKSLLEFIDPCRKEAFQKNIEATMNGQTIYTEYRQELEDGSTIWFGIQYSHSTDFLDNTIGIFMIVSDITKRKIAEEYILKYQNELEQKVDERTLELVKLNEGLHKEIAERKMVEQQLKKLSNVVEQAADHVIITDKNGIIEYVNPGFEKGTGYSQKEVIGLTPRILNSGKNDHGFAKSLWSAVLSGKPFRGISINKKKDGQLYYESMTVTPLLDSNNCITHIVSVGSDITELKKAEEFKLARDAADQANRSKSIFLANMSHEIRTPMNAIIGFSDLLSASITNEKQRSQIEAIRSSGKNLLRIINDILDLSKIEAGKMVIQYETINIKSIIKEVETIFHYTAEEKGLEFKLETSENLPLEIMLDGTRIRQILFNLIGNAVKFTDQGKITLSVLTKNIGSDMIDLILAVKDTGIGIRKDQQQLIFGAFNQPEVQRTAQYGGTGLGLTITKRLTEMMNGSIELISEVGEGSTFTVTIPHIKVKHTTGKTQIEPIFDYSTIQFEPAGVLIADDNQENRKYLVDLLNQYPLTIIEAENGFEAIEKAKLYTPEIILMDYKMPIMNGNEALSRLKTFPETKNIPVIALSASSREVLEENTGTVGFDDFIMKPVIAEELLNRLSNYLKHHFTNHIGHQVHNNSIIETDFTKVQKSQLPQLIEVLEKEFTPIFIDVAKKQVVGQIKFFGIQLEVLGKKYSNPIIVDLGKDLHSYANNFEINKMMKKLNTFPETLNRLKAIAEE